MAIIIINIIILTYYTYKYVFGGSDKKYIMI